MVTWRSWESIYRWFNVLLAKYSNLATKELFLITSLIEYLERRNTVLGFQGIHFPDGFNVADAKAISNAEMIELEPFVRKLFPGLASA